MRWRTNRRSCGRISRLKTNLQPSFKLVFSMQLWVGRRVNGSFEKALVDQGSVQGLPIECCLCTTVHSCYIYTQLKLLPEGSHNLLPPCLTNPSGALPAYTWTAKISEQESHVDDRNLSAPAHRKLILGRKYHWVMSSDIESEPAASLNKKYK